MSTLGNSFRQMFNPGKQFLSCNSWPPLKKEVKIKLVETILRKHLFFQMMLSTIIFFHFCKPVMSECRLSRSDLVGLLYAEREY